MCEKQTTQQQVPHERVVIPPEVLDLVRFMCATWAEIDKFVYEHCDSNALTHYPVVHALPGSTRHCQPDQSYEDW